VLPPCSTIFVDELGDVRDCSLLVYGAVGLRALAAFTQRARGGSQRLRSLALWLRGDFPDDFDDSLFVDLSIVQRLLIVPGDATLRLQQALARAIKHEPTQYAVPAAIDINCSIYAFAPRLYSFLTRRRGDLTIERAASEMLCCVR